MEKPTSEINARSRSWWKCLCSFMIVKPNLEQDVAVIKGYSGVQKYLGLARALQRPQLVKRYKQSDYIYREGYENMKFLFKLLCE